MGSMHIFYAETSCIDFFSADGIFFIIVLFSVNHESVLNGNSPRNRQNITITYGSAAPLYLA